MTNPSRLHARICTIASLFVLGLELPANALPLELDVGKSISVTAGQSAAFVFSATNTNSGDAVDFTAWYMGVQVIPSAGSSGTISVGNLTAATTNPIPIGQVQISTPAPRSINPPLNGSTTYYDIGITTTDTPTTLTAGNSYNLGSLELNASGDASGAWEVYAIQQSVQRTYWQELNLGEFAFGNLPFGSSNTSVLIGTVTAVPEPATCGMAFAIFGIAGLVARRTIRRTSRN